MNICQQYNFHKFMAVDAIAYVYGLYIFDDVLTSCFYKFLCVVIFLMMAKARRKT